MARNPMRGALGFGLALLFLVESHPAWSNDAGSPSLEEKVNSSEAIVVGKVVSRKKIATGFQFSFEHAFIRVAAILKGDVPGTIEVETSGDATELDLGRLCSGVTYLLFLNKGANGIYYSKLGPRGKLAVVLPTKRAAANMACR
jgi:hypothetical protein